MSRFINPDLFWGSADDLASVQLRGTKCRACDETFFGVRLGCEACSSPELDEVPLSREGVLYSYTVLHATPPGAFLGRDGFTQMVVGLVELPEGVRVLSPIRAPDGPRIGSSVRFRLERYPDHDPDAGGDVLTYSFESDGDGVVSVP